MILGNLLPIAFGMTAAVGISLLVLGQLARVTRAAVAAEPDRASVLLHGLERRIGQLLGLSLGVGCILLLRSAERGNQAGLAPAWGLTLAALCVIYFGGIWMSLRVQASQPTNIWQPRARMRFVVAMSATTWLPLVWGALGFGLTWVIESGAGMSVSPALNGLWVPLGIVHAYTGYRVIERIGSSQPLPESIQSLYARMSGSTHPVLAHLLHSKDAGIHNAFATWRPGVGRIYITDRLVERLTDTETVAILLHEEGHLVKRHLAFRFGGALLWQLGASSVLVALGYMNAVTAAGAYAVFSAYIRPPLSQRGEREADAHAAARMESPRPLACALVKLHAAEQLMEKRDRARWAYTHPDLATRLSALGVEDVSGAPHAR
jgi:Zn-dependent protease with chaperone function